MKRFAFAALLTAVTLTSHAQTVEGPWEVRIRALELDPANHSDAIDALAVPRNAIHINNKVLPDIDVEFFASPYWSAELVLTYPQKQTVAIEQSALGGRTDIGTFRHLPPVLTLKYNFRPGASWRPYLGAGVNVTYIYDVNLAVPTGTPATRLDLDHWSVGAAVQGGFDYSLGQGWFLNADLKWARISSDVKLGDERLSEAHINPLLIGVGLGYRW